MKADVFERASRSQIIRDPFPHVVIENVLPEADYRDLEETFPSVEYVAGDEEIVNNRTYLANSDRVLADPRTPEPWRAFFATHTARSLFDSAMRLWQEEIERAHPRLEENFGKGLDAFDVGRRSGKGDTAENRRYDVVLDCQFGVNSPVTRESSTRGPHLDSGAKLFSSLLYFRSEDDDSTGGEYELYRLKDGPFPRSKMKHVPDRYIERVKRIPYRPNTLLTWINSGYAIHGVSPRSVTRIPRRYVAVSGECFGGARPSEFFARFPGWDSPIQKLRARLKV